MRFVICDDIQKLAEAVFRETKRFCEENKKPGMEFEFFMFTNPFEMVASNERLPFDVAVLDIAMPGMDGIQCAKIMREYNKDLEIIFVTSHNEYLDTSFDLLNAFWFVQKSIDYKELGKAIKKLLSGEKRSEKPLNPPPEEKEIKHNNETMFYSAARNSVILHTPQGDKMQYTTLAKVEEENPFCYRISKNMVVNFYFVEKIDKKEVVLYNDTRLKINRSYEKDIINKWNLYKIDPEQLLADYIAFPSDKPEKWIFRKTPGL